MKTPTPAELTNEHFSPRVRAIIRIFSVPGASWILLGLSLLVTILVCLQVWSAHQTSQRIHFESDAAILRNSMIERMHRYHQVLKGACGLFAASEEVRASEFHSYVSSLDINHDHSGILALGYVESVDPADCEKFLEATVRDRDGESKPLKIWPSGERSQCMVVRFVEPLEQNREALGFDVASETRRLTTALKARDTAKAALTPKIELVQGLGKPGAVLFAPIFHPPSPTDDIGSRKASLRGWVYAAFLVEDMVECVRKLTKSKLEYKIFDGTQSTPENLLYNSARVSGASPSGKYSETTTLDIYGQPWTVQVHLPAQGAVNSGMIPISLLAGGGLCMSLLIFGVAQSMGTTSRRACKIATEMTAQLREHREALEASEERLSLVIKGSNDGIWDWNVKTNDVYFSPRWKSMLGYEDHEIKNNLVAWENLIHPDDLERARNVINHHFENITPSYQLEHRLRHKDGSYRWILARGVASRNEDGSPVRMAGSHVDLTELKQAEQKLRQTNESLRRSQTKLRSTLSDLSASHDKLEKMQLELIQAAKFESVGTLAAGVAHEVNNPLQIILMGLDYLESQFPDRGEATSGTLDDMRDAVLRADGITKELLQFSKATEFDTQSTQLHDVLERSLWLIRAELKKSGVQVVRHFTDDLPLVSIDTQKIQQVLINLMINAIQAMDSSGELTLTTATGICSELFPPDFMPAISFKPDESIVTLTLRDDGPGIAECDLPRIFDPFFTTKGAGGGTGLGLSVVKKIIDLHGASIHFRNLPSCGLEVLLTFPCIPQTGVLESAIALTPTITN